VIEIRVSFLESSYLIGRNVGSHKILTEGAS